MNEFIVSLEQAVLNPAHGETDAEISEGQRDRAWMAVPLGQGSLLSHLVQMGHWSESLSPSPVSLPQSPSLSLSVSGPSDQQGPTGCSEFNGVGIWLTLENRGY